MTTAPDHSPTARTDLAWQRTGLGLLSVSGLLGARALYRHTPALLVVAGLACLLGLGVLAVLTPFRYRLLRRRQATGAGVSAPAAVATVTLAVVAVGVVAAVAVLTPR